MTISPINIDIINKEQNILKPSFHLNPGKIRVMTAAQNGIKFNSLKSKVKKIYTSGLFKRMFVENSDFGIPYISAQHMMSINPIEDSKLISKKFTPKQDDTTLFATQILVSCAGTIGNVRLVTEDLNGIIGSQDIIRVISEKETLSDKFVYAYLKTPTIHSYMQSFIYGSVVPRIDPKVFELLPIATFRNDIIRTVTEKMDLAIKFRERSISALQKAHLFFDEKFQYKQNTKAKTVLLQTNSVFQSRLDASFHILFNEITTLIRNCDFKIKRLESFITNSFIPNRGKRIYTKAGTRYFSSSDIFELNPFLIDKFISKKTPYLSSMIVEKNWLLIARSGQEILGSVQIVGDALAGFGVNEHALRVIAKPESSKYIFAFLSSQIGKKYIRAGIFGSAILTIDDSYLKEMFVPILPLKEIDEIDSLVTEYITSYDKAATLETDAINIIEKEID